jgi:hypothetical protein
MLAAVEGLVIAFVGLQAIVIAVAVGVAWSRGRTLDAIRDSFDAAIGAAEPAGPSEEELTDRVHRLRRRAEIAEFPS